MSEELGIMNLTFGQRKLLLFFLKTIHGQENKVELKKIIETMLSDSLDVNQRQYIIASLTSLSETENSSKKEAIFLLGWINSTGNFIDKDINKAIELFKLGSKLDCDWSKNSLANRYSKGEGIEKNLKLAIELWEASAKQGNAVAQNNLACRYINGEGVTKDLKRAIELWEASAKQGHSEAQNNLAIRYFNGEGITKDLKHAIKLWEEAAKQGHSEAQNCLGKQYFIGEGVTKNVKHAIELWEAAAKQDDSHAQYNLAILYLDGLWVKRDLKRALELLEQSAAQGVVESKNQLSNISIKLIELGECELLDYVVNKKYCDIYAPIQTDSQEIVNALLTAAIAGQIVMFEHLLNKYKMNVNFKDNVGNNALIHAASRGKIDMVKHILRKKYLNLLEVNNYGFSSFSCSATMRHIELSQFLLMEGSYFDEKTNSNNTVRELIESQNSILPIALDATKEIFKVIEEKNSLLSERLTFYLTNARRKNDGNTAVHLSLLSSKQNIQLILQLISWLDKNLNLDIQNHNKESVFGLLTSGQNLFLKMLGFYLRAKFLYEENKSTKPSKEEQELNNTNEKSNDIVMKTSMEKMKEFDQFIVKAESCINVMDENDPYIYQACFILGRFLGDLQKPIDSKKAQEHLERIPKGTPFFKTANQILYRLSLSERSVDGDTIKHLLYSGLQDEPMGPLLAGHMFGDKYSLSGIPNFTGFSDPDSCYAFIDTVKDKFCVLEKELKELREVKEQNELREVSFEKEILKLRKELLEAQSKQNKSEIMPSTDSSSSSSSSSSSASNEENFIQRKRAKISSEDSKMTPSGNEIINESNNVPTGEPGDPENGSKKRRLIT